MTNGMNGRSRLTSHDGVVPDLTPHINDPFEHLKNIFKGFCRPNLDIGDSRQPPVVPVDTISSRRLTPQVCGFLCMDSHFKEVEPCIPSCSNEEVELQTTTDEESSITNGHDERAVLIQESPSPQELEDWEIIDMMDDDKPTHRVLDILMVTVVVLIFTVNALRGLGYSFDLSIDDKSFAQSQLSVMGEPWTRDSESLCNESMLINSQKGSEEEAGIHEDDQTPDSWNVSSVADES